jgi:hypothetical protein
MDNQISGHEHEEKKHLQKHEGNENVETWTRTETTGEKNCTWQTENCRHNLLATVGRALKLSRGRPYMYSFPKD